jgi:hypothetical protein
LGFLCPCLWLGGDGFDELDFTWDMTWSAVKQNWRGFSLILEELATCPRYIPEFVVDVGIWASIFVGTVS